MAGRVAQHPPASQWKAFAAGALDLETREAMTEHLRGCRECQSISAEVVANARDAETRDGEARTLDGSPRAAERRAEAQEANATPQRLGRYLVLDVIGAGGMGEVLLAYDPALDRRVAIKVSQRQAGGSETKGLDGRLEREAQALARAADRHVVAVYDTGRVDGRPYVAMEYVPGTTLKAWLGTPRGAKEVLRVFTEAAQGLAAAHRVGVVHRDFKPENVLIDEKGVAHVTDFGLATLHGDAPERERTPSERPHSDSETQEVFNTQRGAVLGTPAYMPPEQWDAQPTDARSDQFSFCVALHEALLGERPFIKPKVKGSRPTFERTPSALKKLKEQSRPIRLVLTRGLALEPSQRFPSMEALLVELERARRPSRVPFYVGTAALALLSIPAAGFALRSPCHGALERVRAPRLELGALPDDVASRVSAAGEEFEARWADAWTQACVETHERKEQPPEVLALRNDCLARQERRYELVLASFAKADALARADALYQLERGPRPADCLPVEPLLLVESPPPEKNAAISSLREKVLAARVAIDLGRYSEAKTMLAELRQPVADSGYERLKAELGFAEAQDAFYADANPRRMRELLRGTLGSALAARDFELAAITGCELVHITGTELGDLSEAQLADELVASLLRRSGNQLIEARLENVRGNMALSRERFDDAVTHYTRARRLREATLGLRHVETANVIDNLASVLSRQGHTAEAEKLHRESLAIYEALLGPAHPEVASTLWAMSWALSEQGKHDEAIETVKRAHSILAAVLGPANIRTVRSRLALVDHYRAAHRLTEARAVAQEVAASAPEGTQARAEALWSVAEVEEESNQPTAAFGHFGDAVKLFERLLGGDAREVLLGRQMQAELLLKLGKGAEAEELLTTLARQLRGADDSAARLAAVLVRLAEASLLRGHTQAALSAAQEAKVLYAPLGVDALQLARADFALAQALWGTGQKVEARELAIRAKVSIEKNASASEQLAQITRWLKTVK